MINQFCPNKKLFIKDLKLKKTLFSVLLLMLSSSLLACEASKPTSPSVLATVVNPPVMKTTSPPAPANAPQIVDSLHPCLGAPAPVQWQHVIVLVYENKQYDDVIGTAPYITRLAEECATVIGWKDADTRVDGSDDGDYHSKPSYATLTNGVSPSVHGLTSDDYDTTTNQDNIFNQLNLAGKSFKDYYDAEAGGCSVRFEGDYHDAIRYYTNVADICDAHDVPLTNFMTDLNNGNLPAFSLILPSNVHNMHDGDLAMGDAYAHNLLGAIFNSPAYAKGDVAIFFMWDEGTANNDSKVSIPNVLIAPSITAGTIVSVQSGNPISHFSALRTWEEMLGLPLLGDTGQAPSLLTIFNGQ